MKKFIFKEENRNCPLCKTYNEEISNYCGNCGKTLIKFPNPNLIFRKKDRLIFIFFIIVLVVSVSSFILSVTINVYDAKIALCMTILDVIKIMAFLMLAFSLKNKTLKIIATIASVFLIGYTIFWNMYQFYFLPYIYLFYDSNIHLNC